MARDGLTALLCAGACSFFLSLSATPPVHAGEPDDAISTTLAVQTALQQGRELLLQNKAIDAVRVLEQQLPRINGNREYLATLRDAYRAYIRELHLRRDENTAQVYEQRLAILDPSNRPAAPVSTSVPPKPMQTPPRVAAAVVPAAPTPNAPPAPASGNTRAAPIVRGKMEEDPFDEKNYAALQAAKGLVARAEEEFAQRHYAEAGRLYAQAYQTDHNSITECRDRWAYCRLRRVGELLNDGQVRLSNYSDLEKEVRVAMSLAPGLEKFGNTLLQSIQERNRTPTAGAATADVSVSVRHQPGGKGQWSIAETENFRIFHMQPQEYAEQAARAAEKARSTMQQKWFGARSENWSPRCDIYLHATAQDYSNATGVPATSPGHSTIRSEGSRVMARRIDLHVDDANLIVAVLPHETTHVVLAGRFGDNPVPRWADEGVAVLSEPIEKVRRHLDNLPRHRQDRQLFPLKQLLQLNDYPDPRYVGSFYAQSVSVVDFLSRLRGPQTFTQFLQEGMQGNYEVALSRHYGIRSFAELERRWSESTFGQQTALSAGR